jgi:hypothetical protein
MSFWTFNRWFFLFLHNLDWCCTFSTSEHIPLHLRISEFPLSWVPSSTTAKAHYLRSIHRSLIPIRWASSFCGENHTCLSLLAPIPLILLLTYSEALRIFLALQFQSWAYCRLWCSNHLHSRFSQQIYYIMAKDTHLHQILSQSWIRALLFLPVFAVIVSISWFCHLVR